MNKQDLNSEYTELINDIENREEFRVFYINKYGIEPSEDELTDYMLDFFVDKDSESSSKVADSPFSKILSLFLIIWFIASLVGMVYFLQKETFIGIMIFGQVFLVFGLIAIFNKVSIGWIFALVGLGFLVVPIFIKYPGILSIEVNWEFLGVFTFGLVFTIAGIGLNLSTFLGNKELKKRCTLPIWAKIIKIDNTKKFMVYDYEYNSKKYKIKGNLEQDCCVDQTVQLMINPNKPREVFFKYNFKDNLFLHIFSLPFIISGIFVMVIAFLSFL